MNKIANAKSSFLLLFLIASVFFYWGIFCMFGAITDEFRSLFEVLPMLLMSFLGLAYLYGGFRLFFIKDSTKKAIFVFLGIAGGLTLFSIVLVGIYWHYYFANISLNWYILTEFAVLLAEFVIGDFEAVKYIKNGTIGKEGNKAPIYPEQFPHLEKSKGIAVAFYLAPAAFFLGDFIVAFYRFGNFSVSPIVYSILLLFILSPGLNLLEMVLRREDKKHWIFRLVCCSLSVLLLAAYYIIFFAFNDAIVLVGQNLFLIDFATVGPISPTLITILLLVSIVTDIIGLIKSQGDLKKEPLKNEAVSAQSPSVK